MSFDIKKNLIDLKDEGITFFRSKVNNEDINNLLPAVEKSFKCHYKIQIDNQIESPSNSIALNCLGDSLDYLELVQKLTLDKQVSSLLKKFLGEDYIINSFSALNAVKDDPNFSVNVHRDIKCFSGNFNMMINLLVMLDNFTLDVGPTKLLPRSHKLKRKPTNEFFLNNSISALGEAGDILVFNSNIWHASSLNSGDKPRRAIAITFSKPFVKQLVDYTKLLSVYENRFDEHMRQILGYNNRIAESLEQWYVPEKDRMYKKFY